MAKTPHIAWLRDPCFCFLWCLQRKRKPSALVYWPSSVTRPKPAPSDWTAHNDQSHPTPLRPTCAQFQSTFDRFTAAAGFWVLILIANSGKGGLDPSRKRQTRGQNKLYVRAGPREKPARRPTASLGAMLASRRLRPGQQTTRTAADLCRPSPPKVAISAGFTHAARPWCAWVRLECWPACVRSFSLDNGEAPRGSKEREIHACVSRFFGRQPM